MPNEVEVFHFDDTRPSFESFAQSNGFKYWLASQLMECLGYATMQPILKAMNHAMAACATLNIPINENFVETSDAGGGRDWKLSRFACYMTVMNGDSKNPKIAQAQAYFVTMAEAFRQYVQEAGNVERVLIRGEISEREKALSGTASAHGVDNYAFFQNAGYRGMYNMDLTQVRARKGVPNGRSPLDFMGKTELAANLFRITQTDEKIRNDDVRGQKPLERTAEQVGRKIRDTMISLSGTRPEALPSAKDLKEVQKGLKRSHKEYVKLDKPIKSVSK
ncbi:MAG: damage-inducible protein D [Pseudorhodoplanes sp.]|nr:MAG: damage-inducible protein D [Pseudorhodoplanes sp.]